MKRPLKFDEDQRSKGNVCSIAPVSLEDGEIEEESEGEAAQETDSQAMVNVENANLNNSVDQHVSSGRRGRKRPKRPRNANSEISRKRKKFSEHNRTGNPRIKQKDLDNDFDLSRQQERSIFDEAINLEKCRLQNQNPRVPAKQRLGAPPASSGRGRRNNGSGRHGRPLRKRGLLGRGALRLHERENKPKTICKFYLDGKCHKGHLCTYSHDAVPPKKKELCKFYLTGFCTKDECLFMHSDFPCKFFHTGAVCYANAECRFSHKPLTDETKMILDKYLDNSNQTPARSDRHRDHSPPHSHMDRRQALPAHLHQNHINSNNVVNECSVNPRPSLLGSPPRHIKEAASEWQQSLMMQTQQQNDKSPPHSVSRPNFYMDTMEVSPQRGSMNGNIVQNRIEPPPLEELFAPARNGGFDTSQRKMNSDEVKGDIDERINYPKPLQIQFYQSTQQRTTNLDTEAEDNSSAEQDCNSAQSPAPSHKEADKSSSPESLAVVAIQEGSNDCISDTSASDINDGSLQISVSNDKVEPAIPKHLPRKQRELFFRIQQQQRMSKVNFSEDEEKHDKNHPNFLKEEDLKITGAGDYDHKIKEDSASVKEIVHISDHEVDEQSREKWFSSDEDDDEDDDLGDKSLTNALKRLQEMGPPTTQVAPPAPFIDIAKMLSSIKNQSNFQQNMLSTTAPPLNLHVPRDSSSSCFPVKRDPRTRARNTTSLPEISALNSVDKPSSITLNDRDPRFISRTVDKLKVENTSTGFSIQETVIMIPRTDDVYENDRKLEEEAFQLQTVTVTPPNYSSYLIATQNDNKLLEDPRLKKFIGCQTPPRPLATQPLPSESQVLEQDNLKKESSFQTSPHARQANLILAPGSSTVQNSDPRLKRNIPPSPQSPVHSLEFNSPNLTIMDSTSNTFPKNMCLPPMSVGVTNPLTPRFPSLPQPRNSVIDQNLSAILRPPHVRTHMPRGFVDPRFARLQMPTNRRRGQNIRHNKVPPKNLPKDATNKTSNRLIENKTDEPEKSQQGEKNSRKIQMDYASPLSSYEENTPSEGSAYNRRPNPRTTTQSASVTNTSILPVVAQPSFPYSDVKDVITVNMDINSEVSNTASLRDVFKTIDPTASPFC